MQITILPFLLALAASLMAVPAIIKVAYHKRLVDDPRMEERKIHRFCVPNLGGVAVFSVFALISSLFTDGNSLPHGNFIFAAGIIIFSIGLKDDLVALDPYKKFLAQFITAFIAVYFADFRLTNFQGVFDIYEISPVLSYLFTTISIVFIINSFNLIDGINGLLGGVSVLVCLVYGGVFYLMNESGLSVLAFTMAGSVLGFLRYNAGRARIFMGDAGAYSIGFVIALLSIRFIELNPVALPFSGTAPFIKSAPAIAIAILVIPTYDTLRVFIKRISSGKSPFFPDRNHLHHRLLAIGFSHSKASLTLVGVNVLIIALAVSLQDIGTPQLLIVLLCTVQFINILLWLYDARMNLINSNRARVEATLVENISPVEDEDPSIKLDDAKNIISVKANKHIATDQVNTSVVTEGGRKVPKKLADEILQRLEEDRS